MALHRQFPPAVPVDGAAGFTLLEVLAVVAVMAIVMAMAIPLTQRTVGSLRLQGDARGVLHVIGLAKMRAASDFTHARVHADLSTNTYWLETWQKTGTPGWITQGGVQTLSRGVAFGFADLTSPPGSLPSLAQAPACLDDSGSTVANSACIVFNSRGMPIDDTGAPTALDALFLADDTGVYGTTVSPTGMSRFWWTPAHTAIWTSQ
jgi:prepilin-type N-terminal cleavage/methylation domain-containing protein